ncbi:hypothetical protein D3C85_891330 [compost metagenome]
MQFRQGALRVLSGRLQLSQGKQATGAIEQQHRGSRVGLRILRQRLVDNVQAVAEVAPQKGQATAQESQGLMHALRVLFRDHLAVQQTLQLRHADARTANVVGDDERTGFGDCQGEMIDPDLARHIGEAVDDGLDPAFAQQVETVVLDHREQAVELSGAP